MKLFSISLFFMTAIANLGFCAEKFKLALRAETTGDKVYNVTKSQASMVMEEV